MFFITKGVFSFDGNATECYGIECTAAQISIPDLSTNQQEAEKLVSMLNTPDLSACHYMDVIRDFVEGLYMV